MMLTGDAERARSVRVARAIGMPLALGIMLAATFRFAISSEDFREVWASMVGGFVVGLVFFLRRVPGFLRRPDVVSETIRLSDEGLEYAVSGSSIEYKWTRIVSFRESWWLSKRLKLRLSGGVHAEIDLLAFSEADRDILRSEIERQTNLAINKPHAA
ncbi:MAG: hypothetical protein NXI18_21680 [Alphaproteobacteria bacterium]|nr:hypothetical protein [Alphaproteobacteria bacterium]